MKKILAVLAMAASIGFAGDEFYRPINISFTNAVSSWTNNIGDPIVLKNVITHSGVSNEEFTVTMVSATTSLTNTIVATHSNAAYGSTSSAILAIPMNIGDVLQFTSTYTTTATVAGDKKSAVINAAKNK